MIQRLALGPVLFAFVVSGCATTRFETYKPIEVNKRGLLTTYEQKGRELEISSLLDGLDRDAATRPGSRSYVAFLVGAGASFWTGVLLAAAPLLLPRFGVKTSVAPAYVGAGFIAVSFPMLLFARSSLRHAVETHNRGLRRPEYESQ